MCTITFDRDELLVLFDSLTYFYLQSEDRLINMSPDGFGTHYEKVWRNNYEASSKLLDKIKCYG